MASFTGAHFPKDISLTCVRWYVADPLRSRHVDELLQERGVSVDHATIKPLGGEGWSPARSRVPRPPAAGVAQLADG
jgi:transposase-like protein